MTRHCACCEQRERARMGWAPVFRELDRVRVSPSSRCHPGREGTVRSVHINRWSAADGFEVVFDDAAFDEWPYWWEAGELERI